MSITPDTKDWTWVLNNACPECGCAAQNFALEDIAPTARSIEPLWRDALSAPHASQRPAPQVWSVVEYGAHIADVLTIMRERLELMLAYDNPNFANWDQDQAALDGGYAQCEADTVMTQISSNLELFASAYEHVQPEQQDRTGMRSNGSAFTVLTLGQYALHDLIHHGWDVTKDNQ